MLEISAKGFNMQSRDCVLVVVISIIILIGGCTNSQAPPPTPGTAGGQVSGNMAQLMRGILFPASNVVFAAQDQNPADVKPADDPSTAINPLQSTFGKWQAV